MEEGPAGSGRWPRSCCRRACSASAPRWPSGSSATSVRSPWLAGAVLAGGILGPVCLMAGLDRVSGSAAFLLGQGFRIGGAAAGGHLIGAACYGLSLVLFIKALKGLGAFRTGIFFSLAPFVGSLASVAILGDRVGCGRRPRPGR